MRQTNAELHHRLRHVAQVLIAEVGAGGPMDAEAAAERAVATILTLRDDVDRLRAENADLRAEWTSLHKYGARCVDYERAAVVAWLRRPCTDPTHDDRWCPACGPRLDDADIIEAGKHLTLTP